MHVINLFWLGTILIQEGTVCDTPHGRSRAHKGVEWFASQFAYEGVALPDMNRGILRVFITIVTRNVMDLVNRL